MKGKVLGFSKAEKSGVILDNEQIRYDFDESEWKSDIEPRGGLEVDFVALEGKATAIYSTSTNISDTISNVVGGSKKIPAALLAFFLGSFGVHKFYLGYNTEGAIMLLVFIFGFILLGIPSLIIGGIAFIEFIIYLVKSDEEFENTYVKNKRGWF